MPAVRKYSRKREAILAAIRSTKTHPTADWVYAQLKPDIPDLSLGTVYRNIALFREEGVVRQVCVVSGQERFDGNTANHPHLVCTACGSVIDIGDNGMEPDTGRLEEENDILIKGFDVTFYGLCPRCKYQSAAS